MYPFLRCNCLRLCCVIQLPLLQVYFSGPCRHLDVQLRHRDDGLLTCQPNLVRNPDGLGREPSDSWHGQLPPVVLAFQRRYLSASTLRSRALVQAGNANTCCRRCKRGPSEQPGRSPAGSAHASAHSKPPRSWSHLYAGSLGSLGSSTTTPGMAAGVPFEPWTAPYACSSPFDLDEALLAEPLPSLAQVCREVCREA